MHDPYADQPTSQFPGHPAELPPTGVYPQRQSFLRRHRGPLIVGASAVAAVLTGGVGLTVAGAASGTAPAATPAASTPAASTPAPHHAAPIRGTVQSESGNTWTVRTGAGATITVTITSKTHFGRKNESASAADFPVGAAVVITGRTHDAAVTASRITAAA